MMMNLLHSKDKAKKKNNKKKTVANLKFPLDFLQANIQHDVDGKWNELKIEKRKGLLATALTCHTEQ